MIDLVLWYSCTNRFQFNPNLLKNYGQLGLQKWPSNRISNQRFGNDRIRARKLENKRIKNIKIEPQPSRMEFVKELPELSCKEKLFDNHWMPTSHYACYAIS